MKFLDPDTGRAVREFLARFPAERLVAREHAETRNESAVDARKQIGIVGQRC
jgi:hypothetical protein